MTIAVTGASGFIGTELLAKLAGRPDTNIIALTRGVSSSEETPYCVWRSTDYSEDSLKAAIAGADTVIHLAGVRGTEADPEKFRVNEEMTENLLKAMTSEEVRRIIFASTMSVYDDEDLIPWTEDTPLKGRTEYGSSKIRCEELIRRYAAECGFSYGIVRIAQVLGMGEKRRGMMNVFIDTAAEKGRLKVMGRSIAKKHYIYVKDLVNVLALLACGSGSVSADENITVNAGMPDVYTNLEVAEAVNRVYENPVPIDYDDSYPETGRAFHMDTTRLKEKLGYEALDMESAVRDLCERS